MRAHRPHIDPQSHARKGLVALVALIVSVVNAAPLAAQQHEHPEGDLAGLGTVTFPVSCDDAVAPRFERAVAALHSFWFDTAAREFEAVASADPTCAMAHWGIAMTMMGNPMTRIAASGERLEAGRAAAARARELSAGASERERMYVDAVVAYYEADDGFGPRMTAHEEALDALRRAYPDDAEATTFYARAVVANAPPADLTFARQLYGAELMQPLFEATPRHPGLAHYLIHAYDYPSLAQRGAEAAFAYADIAPDAPHALHMPSHIFTRLGYWDESIETNERSARAEPEYYAAVHPLDYMVYAYLQQGRDDEARAVIDRTVPDSDRFYGGIIGYNFEAMRARYALERDDWAAAAALPVHDGAPPYVEAVTRFARALGAARAGDVDAAAVDAEALARLHAALAAAGDSYWATVVQAQRVAAEAWIARARGHYESAVLLAGEAAELEETVEKHPVTPGPLLPARELLGDLLLGLGRADEALAAYDRTLEREPRRARTLYGAARAAEAAERHDIARARYAELLEVMAEGAKRPALERARQYLAGR